MNHCSLRIATLFTIFCSVFSSAQIVEPYKERPEGYEQAEFETVFGLCLGPDQNLYVGHTEGVSKYNGYTFELLPFNGRSRASDNINFAPDNRLWGRTFSGDIFYLEGDSLINHSISRTTAKVLPSFWKSDNALYLRFNSSLYLIKDTNLIHIKFQTASNLVDHWAIISLNDSTDVFINTSLRTIINLKNPDKNIISPLPKERIEYFKNNRQHQRSIRWNGEHYLIGLGDLKLKETKTNNLRDVEGVFYTDLSYPKNTKINEVKVHQQRALTISGYSGLKIYDLIEEREFHLLKNQVASRAISNQQGGIWFGTLKDGLYHIPSIDVLKYSLESTKSDLYKSFRLNDTLIALGRMNGEIELINHHGNYLKTITLPNTSEIQSAVLDGTMLFIFCEDVYQYDIITDRIVNQMISTSAKDFWCGDSCVLTASSLGMYDLYRQENGRPMRIHEGKWFTDIQELTPNILLLASKEGLFKYFLDTEELIPIPSEWPIEPTIRQVILWKDKIVTNIEGKGVYYLDENDVYHSIDPELKNVKRILSHQNQLYVLQPDQVIEYDANLEKRIIFNKKSILPNLKIQDFQVSNSHLFLFLNREYLKIPLDFKNPATNFTINLLSEDHSFRLDGDTYYSDYTDNFFKLKFEVSPSFIGKEITHVKYRVKGLEDEWNSLPQSDGVYELYLYMLPWGSLNLEILVEKGGQEMLLEYPLFVYKPYWLQWWFLTLMSFLLLTILFGIYRWRILILNRKAKRTFEAQKIKNQLLSAELTAIRSQMQPHFIYNVLTSIQAKILKGERKKAYESANSFSQLMRNVLDNSKKETILLKEEIEFLKSYVSLESDRFEEGVKFNLEIDPDLNVEEIQIPTLICQPFVENAFKHGLRFLEADRELKLEIKKAQNGLKIVIEDNGVGRLKSAEINRQNKSYHKSFATKAMEERVQRINDSNNGLKVNYEIIDLEQGTQVNIMISYV